MAAATPTPAFTQTEALRELAAFPLVEALFGRRSRGFALGDEVSDGPLAYRSRHEPVPFTELERMLVLSDGRDNGFDYLEPGEAQGATQWPMTTPIQGDAAGGPTSCATPLPAGPS
jgi:hypothetical protein